MNLKKIQGKFKKNILQTLMERDFFHEQYIDKTGITLGLHLSAYIQSLTDSVCPNALVLA